MQQEPVVETFYNYVRDGSNGPEPRLKWLEPCPAIQWAGELKRDRSFLINSLSNDPGHLHVKIFNPLGGRSIKLKGMKDPNGRILDVLLKYRKHGEVNWKKAMSEVGGGTKLYEMDFVHESTTENIPAVEEDVFGYIGMDWYIGGGTIVDGTYEIVVEVQCTDVGGPDEFKVSGLRTIFLYSYFLNQSHYLLFSFIEMTSLQVFSIERNQNNTVKPYL